MGAYISRLRAAVGATVGAIARVFGGGIGVVIPIVLPYYSNYLYSILNLHCIL